MRGKEQTEVRMGLEQDLAGRSIAREFGEEEHQDEEDWIGDRQADSTALRHDRVSHHIVRDGLESLSCCSKTLIPQNSETGLRQQGLHFAIETEDQCQFMGHTHSN